MDDGILKRDEELTKLNDELELKASILMKEVENVMKMQERDDEDAGASADDSHSLDSVSDDVKAAVDKHFAKARPLEKPDIKSLIDDDGVLPAICRSMGHEPVMRFLKAKVKILTGEIERQQMEHKRKAEQWRSREGEVRSAREERDRATQQVSSLSQQVARLNSTLSSHTERLQRLDADNTALSNEVASLKKDVKAASHRATTAELRMNRALEEGESLRSALRNARAQEKEEREEQRRQAERQAANNQRLERQRAELALAFRKQLLLCNNLQRQKELLIAGAALHAIEGQFDTLLQGKQAQSSMQSTTTAN